MSRSRAFTLFQENYASYELTTLRTWINTAPTWLLRYGKDRSAVYAYVRFEKLVSLDKVRKLFPKVNVQASTAKYTTIADEYSRLGAFETVYKRSSARECEKKWQKGILETLAIKGDRGSIRWVDDLFFSVDASNLIKKLSTLDNVLVLNDPPAEIRVRVRQELIIKQRAIDTVVLIIPPMQRVDASYFTILNQLRDGYIADVASDGKGTEYGTINTLVITPCPLNMDMEKNMKIIKIVI